MTSYAYDSAGNLAAVTNALGVATVYQYDLKGNRTYEGGGTYPVTYAYDAFNSVTNMTTYRDESLQSGDVTTWLYDEATGLVTNKVYADGHGPAYSYTPNGNLASRTWARGVVTSYLYDGWNSLTNTSYSDGTPAVSLSYDAMGRQVSATDAAGTTVTAYDAYGAVSSESTAGLYSKTISRTRDVYGRDLGYTVDNSRKSIIEYEADTGRMKRVMFAGAWFTWSYLGGTDLKSRLQYGGSGYTDYTYEQSRDLLTEVKNHIYDSDISVYGYVNDAIGRRTEMSRSGTMMSETRTDAYGYNGRNELTSAVKSAASSTNLTEYAYTYDDIGNRLTSSDLGTNRTYTANSLNQYSSISNLSMSAEDFIPQFDLDGNQTLVKTSTGVWSVTYNPENRPVGWSCGPTNIVMLFDRKGRRVEYVESVSEEEETVVDGVTNIVVTVTTNVHHRFVYDGFNCVQRLNAMSGNAVELAFGWDPAETVATRPLWMQRQGGWNFFFTHDGNKNVSDVVSFQQARGIPAHYEYAPFGTVVSATRNTNITAFDVRSLNPYRFSSEYHDDAIGLVYYNYRHYDAQYGRWFCFDPSRRVNIDLYLFCGNNPVFRIDNLGNEWFPSDRGNGVIINLSFDEISEISEGLSDALISALENISYDIEGIWQFPSKAIAYPIAWIDMIFEAEHKKLTFCGCDGQVRTVDVYTGGKLIPANSGMTPSSSTIFLGENFYRALSNRNASAIKGLKHECGHIIQAEQLGPLYLPLVVPFTFWSHEKPPFNWAENWADRNGAEIKVNLKDL